MTFTRWQGPDPPAPNGSSVRRLRLESNPDAPGTARAALGALQDDVSEDVLERATLLTSEVVTNSVRHSHGPTLDVQLWAAGGTVDVITYDDGPGFEPVARTNRPGAGGLGLPLLDLLCSAWGSGVDDSHGWVWFEVTPLEDAAIAQLVGEPLPDAMPTGLLDVRMLVDSMRDHALIALDPHGFVTNWGHVAEEMTGYPADEFLGRLLSDLYVPASAQAFAQERETARRDGWHQGERMIERRDGTQLWTDVALAPIVSRAGTPRGFSALISDVTSQKVIEHEREGLISELRDLAMTDELTGLPNRRRWVEELNRELARSRRSKTSLAVAMVDLNGFKRFNDANGHPAGDKLLQEVARCWSEAVRTTDMLARYGGDEFIVSLPECPPEVALTVIGRVLAATPDPVNAAAGIAVSDGSEDAEAVVARADDALYNAKRSSQSLAIDARGTR